MRKDGQAYNIDNDLRSLAAIVSMKDPLTVILGRQ